MPDKIVSEYVSRPKAAAVLPSRTPYDDSFYLEPQSTSSRSADCVVPIALSLVRVKSLIDVGCGVGTWAEAFLKHGVE
jgi:predicted RNA methylase